MKDAEVEVEVDDEGVAQIREEIRRILGTVCHLAEAGGFAVFAAYGTALGAVRDGDVIPWDVDGDLWVPTSCYDDLCAHL